MESTSSIRYSHKYQESSLAIIKKLVTQEVESDEYYFNPGWFSAQEYELYELKDSNIQ